jgi:hypothetical protein
VKQRTENEANGLKNENEKEILKTLEILMHQPLPNQKDIHFINRISALYFKHGSLFVSISSFQYGVIQGKRMERERRRMESCPNSQ